jgi:hypothetical protein
MAQRRDGERGRGREKYEEMGRDEERDGGERDRERSWERVEGRTERQVDNGEFLGLNEDQVTFSYIH